jgi:hypothetical protein
MDSTTQAATIRLFLVHGSPNGLRTAELSNWSGKAIASPRTEVTDLLNRSEVENPGFYLLSGVDAESGDRAIYIGEGENVSKRLKTHASKDFWNTVTVFVSKDENLTKAHIRYLEGKLIQLASDIGNSILMNEASSGAKLPESEAAEMDVFLEKCLQLMPVLGLNDFTRPIGETDRHRNVLQCEIKGLTASGKRTTNGFTVFAGSQAVLKHRASARRFAKIRDQHVEKGILQEQDDHFVFTKDMEFGSPSTAGAIVRGGSTNGLTAWKDINGIPLKEIEQNK